MKVVTILLVWTGMGGLSGCCDYSPLGTVTIRVVDAATGAPLDFSATKFTDARGSSIRATCEATLCEPILSDGDGGYCSGLVDEPLACTRWHLWQAGRRAVTVSCAGHANQTIVIDTGNTDDSLCGVHIGARNVDLTVQLPPL